METPVGGTGLAPGNCLVGGIATGLGTYGIYTLANFDVVIADFKATGQSAALLAQIAENCY